MRKNCRSQENHEVKSLADEICNDYGKRGYEFLRKLFEENNP